MRFYRRIVLGAVVLVSTSPVAAPAFLGTTSALGKRTVATVPVPVTGSCRLQLIPGGARVDGTASAARGAVHTTVHCAVSFGATILDPACSGSQVLTTTLPGGHAVLLHTIALKPGLLCGDPEVQWSGSAAALHASVVGQHGSVASRSASPRPAAKSAADADEKFTQSLA